MANRHGLITGATGTGKTITLPLLAESFSRLGVPVFSADVKGDLSGIAAPGQEHRKITDRLNRIGLKEPPLKAVPSSSGTSFAKQDIRFAPPFPKWGPSFLPICWN